MSYGPIQMPYGFWNTYTLKSRNYPCGTRTDFEARKEPIRDPQGACTITLKAEWGPYTCGPVCDPYGEWLSTGQTGRKPVFESCSAFSQTSYGTRQKYFKDRARPRSMPCNYLMVLSALALTGTMKLKLHGSLM